MKLRGLLLEKASDTGGCVVTPFGVVPRHERQAGRDVLACLANGLEFSLSNDLDEGREGHTSFRGSQSGLVRLVGGHGWQSGWEPATEADVLKAVAELVAHPRRRGSLIRHIKAHRTQRRN